jgi:tRNA threonylcarbamoyladenosine biosynthesis protein TsaE
MTESIPAETAAPTPSIQRAVLKNEAATAALGAALARVVRAGMSLHLHGDLGVGKTALTRALLHAAGHSGHVKSPTYTLVEPYTVRLGGKAVEAMHFDLYRMVAPEEFLEAGFRDEFGAGKLCIVEWPEKAEGLLPRPDIEVFLSVRGDGREVELRGLSAQGLQCLDQLHFAPNL